MKPILFLIMWALAGLSTPAVGLERDPKGYIARAIELVDAGQHELARTYLEPALIAPGLNRGERSQAYYLRGFSFFDQGMYVSAGKDYNRALEFYPGNPVVLTAIAHLHAEGLGVEADSALAVAFFEQAARAEHPPAYLNLGIAYLRGRGVEADLTVARDWLRKAVDAGMNSAMLYLGQSYRAPLAVPPQPELARQWYQKAADAGESDGFAYLGFMAENDELPEAGDGAALDYFQQAADAGSAVGLAKLAHMYLTGNGITADPARARDLFHQAAEQDQPTAFMGLGYLYETGTAVDRDDDQALSWYRRAAEAGMLDAQLRMAYAALHEGDDLDSQRQASQWFARAATQDSPQALNDYAWLLATSPFDGVRNGPQAVTLALQAVERNRSPGYLDTLAAAYAEAGKFDRAVETQLEALKLAPEGETALVSELQSHLEAFRAGEPWRE